MTQSLRTLLAGLIDYAGLFPPAGLEMGPAVEQYSRYIRGEREFALGRFICPVSRLEEMSRAASALMPGTFATSGYREYAESTRPWSISAILDGKLPDAFEESLDEIDAFNEHHSAEEHGLAKIDTIELKVTRPDAIDEALDELPEEIFPFFEFDVAQDCRGFVAALAGNADSGGAGAKLRCGGVKPEMIPAPEHVADAILSLAAADVPFKATAGLHHPWRGVQNLTYEKSPPRAVMHGFVNVFLGAALAKARRLDRETLLRVLGEEDARVFAFTEQGAAWRDVSIDTASLARVRETFALSYGSCSFEEPFDDLARAGLV